jgi:hypothetical protein
MFPGRMYLHVECVDSEELISQAVAGVYIYINYRPTHQQASATLLLTSKQVGGGRGLVIRNA